MIGLSYSTCVTCKELMHVLFVGQETHPLCESSPTERDAQAFVEAIQREDEPEIIRLEKVLAEPKLPRLGTSALWYAEQGWPVFLLAPNSKQPLISKRDGGNGLHDATTDVAQIREWWTKYPSANIGLATGHLFDVIDIDGPTGIASMQELGDGVLPEIHGKVGTPNGFHLYVKNTGDGNRAGVRPGIDYRGQGGYVVAPPSQIDFKRYTWLLKPSPAIVKEAA